MSAPSIESARRMGEVGAKAHDAAERLAFEACMAGHCWALCATWTGAGYIGDREGASGGGGYVCPRAMRTRQLWAAWRDRAALARTDDTAPGAGEQPNAKLPGPDPALKEKR